MCGVLPGKLMSKAAFLAWPGGLVIIYHGPLSSETLGGWMSRTVPRRRENWYRWLLPLCRGREKGTREGCYAPGNTRYETNGCGAVVGAWSGGEVGKKLSG